MNGRPLPRYRSERERKVVDQFAVMGLGTRTIEQYLSAIRYAERWCCDNGYALRTLPATGLLELAETLPFTWSSRRRMRSALKAYWEATGRKNAPTKAIRVPRKPYMRSRALEIPVAAELEKAARARGDRKGLVVLLGLYLGLRRLELAQLRWRDFDAELEWVTVAGKGDIIADLPIHPVLREALRSTPNLGDDWLFPGRFGASASPVTMWEWVKQVAKEAQLGPIATHVLRHTCLTTANDATGDLRAVQMFARHARPDTTAGYTRVSTKRMIHVMLSLDYQATEEAS